MYVIKLQMNKRESDGGACFLSNRSFFFRGLDELRHLLLFILQVLIMIINLRFNK